MIGLSPLPTPHPNTFQRILVRSSMACYRNFNLDMGRSPSFASTPSDYGALFRLAFAPATHLKCLTLPKRITRRLIMQKARRHHACMTPTACKRMVSGSISPPYSGYFSPFPHGTGSLSVSQEYLALPDGAGKFNRDFSGPDLLRILPLHITLPIRDSHPLWPIFPNGSRSVISQLCSPTTPI